MKPPQKLRRTVIGVTLLLAALSSSALTLGRPRGAVLIGQPLDVVVPVRAESGDDTSAQCFDADVFHADSRVSGARVNVTVEPGASPQDVNVRIRSGATVDEPVVTIYLRAGCLQRTTRRYVLLADVAPDVVTLPSVGAAGAARVPVPVQPLPDSAAQRGTARRQGGAGTAGAPVGVDTAPTQAAAERRRQRREEAAAARAAGAASRDGAAPAAAGSASATAPGQARAPASASAQPSAQPSRSVVRKSESAHERTGSRSRLKLDPLDLLVEVDPVLRSTPELSTPVTENPQARAEAAALWRAINAQPQDILRDTQRLQTLETDVKGLRDVAARNQANIKSLSEQLQQAQAERYANQLVYSLVALLAAALGLAGFFWWRSRQVSQTVWWSGRGADADEDGPAAPAAPGKPITEVDVDLGVDESLFASLKPPASARSDAPDQPTAPVTPPARYVRPPVDSQDFAASLPGMSRAVNAEELFDIQQQADFFVSLGQHEQAIEVLKNHISDNVETSALAYLDLFRIYHSLNRRDDYEALREDFNRVFNGQVPPFDRYTDASNGLESYRSAMSRIEALWPSSKVLEVIEESIFRKPGTGDGEAFDLEAYRELLLLYAIAKDVVDRHGDADFEYSGSSSGGPDSGHGDSQSGATRPRFSATAIQPLSASNFASSAFSTPAYAPTDAVALPEIPLPKPSPRLGLDIDLGELEPEPQDFVGSASTAPMAFNPEDFHSESVADDIDSLGESLRGESRSDAGTDNNLIDFDLFDDATEAEIDPKRIKRS